MIFLLIWHPIISLSTFKWFKTPQNCLNYPKIKFKNEKKIGQLCGHKNRVFGGRKYFSDIKLWSYERREFFETINPFLKFFSIFQMKSSFHSVHFWHLFFFSKILSFLPFQPVPLNATVVTEGAKKSIFWLGHLVKHKKTNL